MRGRGCLGVISGMLLFALAALLLAGSLRELDSALKNRVDALDGIGWGKTEEGSRLDICCKALEECLPSMGDLREPDLLRDRRGEGGADEALELLDRVDEAALSGEEWLLYRKLLYCRNMRKAGRALPDYEALLSEFGGILQRVREVCYVSCFTEREDILACLKWMEELPADLEGLLGRLAVQRGLAGFYAEESIAGSLLLCRELGGEQGLLRQSFREKLTGCAFLAQKERESLLAEGERLMEEAVPALERLEGYLEGMEGEAYGGGLCGYPEGAAYYDHLLECNTGSGMNAEEMYWYLDAAREEILQAEEPEGEGLEEILRAEEPEGEGLADIVPGEWEEVLNQLYRHTSGEFPGMEDMDWQVSRLPDSFFGRVSKAMFRKREGENHIYVSDSLSGETALSVYQVLAHEGFPGHAYSYNVDRRIPWPAVDRALVFQGYAEGWAVWAEFAAADWLAEGQEEYRELLRRNLYDEIVLSQMDIGIHGLNWSMEDLEAFTVMVYGEEGRGAASALWNVLADNPGIYQSYTVGYLKVKELEKWCGEQGMDVREFASLYQQCGQAPFSLVEEWMHRRVRDE